jgi:RsiW-degrading membrane proteinase PrsW (M82 family)
MVVLRTLLGMTKAVATVAAVLVIAIGPPLVWVWVGSQVQGGTAPSGTAIVTVIAGLVVSYMLIGLLISWIASRSKPDSGRPIRYAWNRSLRDERYQGPKGGHALENAFVGAAILVTIIVTVWFFVAGNPGVPVSP